MRTIKAFILIFLTTSHKCLAVCSSEYGAEPCKFIPAAPGRTPSCARPGLTYCEHPSHYPGQLIHYLIEKWRYDYTTLLSNETPEEFNSYYIPPDTKYGPKPVYGPPPNSLHGSYAPEPIHIPKPLYPALQQPGNTYIPPREGTYQNFSDGFYSERRPLHSQEQQLPTNQLYNYKIAYKAQGNYDPSAIPMYNQLNVYSPANQLPVTHYNPNHWWKRQIRDLSKRHSYLPKRRRRALSQNTNGSLKNATSASENRKKRQSALTGEQLCQSRSQYIMPRAALNNKGNWMYVVNMPEVDNKYTQLVKSETCISQQCNGLCSLPLGYTSRCEQKYVQKRLVALEGSGNQLYTDIFWFPSCCVCTISN